MGGFLSGLLDNPVTSSLTFGLLGGQVGKAAQGLLGGADMPEIPDFLKAAQQTSNLSRYSESTPYGSVNWSLRPGADPSNPQLGDYIRTTTLSPTEQSVYDAYTKNQLGAGGALEQQVTQLNGGQQGIADAIYGNQTKYLDRRFGDQTSSLENQLQNQGLVPGSAAYDTALRNLRETQNEAYTTAANNATIGADTAANNNVSRIASLLAGTKNQSPVSANIGSSPDILGAVSNLYGTQLGQTNANNAQSSNNLNALTGLASAGLMAFSDRRLKSNIKPVGQASNGLQIYDYTINGRSERGYMADEVAERFPEAVLQDPSGYMLVDYSAIGGRP